MENGGSSKKIPRQLNSKTFNTLKYRLTVSSHTYSQEDDATQGTPGKLFYSDIKKNANQMNHRSTKSQTNVKY